MIVIAPQMRRSAANSDFSAHGAISSVDDCAKVPRDSVRLT
jgi:hypothetical protein